MSQHALVRVRRTRSSEPTLRLLVFQLRHHWFCIPLAIARRVLPKPSSTAGSADELIQLGQDHIPVLDTARLVYGTDKPQLAGTSAQPAATTTEKAPLQHIVVVELDRGDSVGLIIDGTPILKRVRQSAFSPVPPIYVTVQKLRGISSIVKPPPEATDNLTQPMLLLTIETLLQQSQYLSPIG